ncbi:alginate lyase family protein [Flavobacterium aquiphilum]|uniref:alginate lyase family protein n=1 Tax=Flavobacterium aquiphilum TaxID=3003261 RepID=UPI0024811A39|nr:alginate lyase family protein [Flavobacterium aquiphilum]
MKYLLTAFKFVFLLSVISCSSADVTTDQTPAVVDSGTTPNPGTPAKTFVHPGLLHTQADFDRMKLKVNASAQPWIAGWNKLIANSHAQLTYSPSPVVKLIRGGSSVEEPQPDNYSAAFNDAAAAYQTAIRWKITGDVAYANKSIQILNTWANTCTSISGDSNKVLGAGIYGYQFANAAEIMRTYSGWSATDFDKFKTWMKTVFLPISKDFLVRHNNTCISHYWANWDLCSILNVMSIGVLTDDADLYNTAVTYLKNGIGNGQLIKAVWYDHKDGTAQIQESGRDQGHTLLCVGFLSDIAQSTWNQGDDFYSYNDNLILKGAEYAAKYNFTTLTIPFQPYNNCDNVNHVVNSADARGGIRPIWNAIYNHYLIRKGLSVDALKYVSLARNIVETEGGGGDYGPNSGGFDSLGFGTLLYSLE